MGPLINGTAATRIPGAAMTSMDLLGGASPSSAASHFSTNGWFGRLFEYAADEPGSQAPHRTPWEQIAPNCDNVHGANSDFRALVVSTFQHVNDPSTTDNPPSPAIPVGFLPPKINILVPNIVELESTSGNTRSTYDSWQASRSINEVWQYVSCSSYSCGGGSSFAW